MLEFKISILCCL